MGKYFGTDGVRGEANRNLNAVMAYRIGRYIGQFPNGHKNKVLLCRDTRLSGDMFACSVTAGLLSSGSDVYDVGVSTTPSVSYLVANQKFDFGIMISASHNPYTDNGIKVFNRYGEKLDESIEKMVEEYMDSEDDNLPLAQADKVGRLIDGKYLLDIYIDWLASKAKGDYDGIKVLVDCANGSASPIAPRLFAKLGVEATFMSREPDGLNINRHCGATHLKYLKARMDEGDFDLGFAFDGDADRFMAFSRDGILIDGDLFIYLNAIRMRKRGTLFDNRVVITVMSNYGLRKALENEGIAYETVAVGDKNVQLRLKERNLSLGGEQSGHVIFLKDLNTGDGLLSSIKLLNLFKFDSEIFDKIHEYKAYPQILKNVRFSSKEALASFSSSKRLADLIAEKEKVLGDGRVLVRSSGTEPLLRIMAECMDEDVCAKVVDELVEYAEEEAKE
ncbi:MAG: phosphoglucosamine mutase [Bacilli bacterium]|nr:phosphoglucosamine mutase [Bacilli bacterium]